MHQSLTDMLGKRVLIFDGAMGTMLERLGAPAGCNENLVRTHPDIVGEVHRLYLKAGADCILTGSFGANRMTLADHGLDKDAAEINREAAAVARRAVASVGGDRFVVGDIGPGSKLPTLGHVSFDELCSAYVEQIAALIEGGVDGLLIETCQDPLQIKAACAAAHEAFAASGTALPFFVSVTVETSGTMLLGTEILAALAAIAPYGPAAFGLNCATGPERMVEHVSALAHHSPFAIICQPNAGMPANVDGKPHYPLDPEAFAEKTAALAQKNGIALVGGCCGTTPDHIRALAQHLHGKEVSRRMPQKLSAVSSLYRMVTLDQEPRPFLVGEQTNVSGSKRYRELLEADAYDAMADVAREVASASHALDICVARPGRDEVRDITELTSRVVQRADAPLVIDSTNPDAIAAALARCPGRAIINSINLEDGGVKARKVLALARRFGAAVVALTIDENGMAKSVEEKCAIAHRLVAIAEDAGLTPESLLIDALIFTLASGDPELFDAGRETLAAIARIKRENPGVRVLLGVSNVSFGLPPRGRRLLTSVFLHRAIEAGADAAIINPSKILPYAQIPDDARILCERLIDNDRDANDPLTELLKLLDTSGDLGRRTATISKEAMTPRDALRQAVIDGRREGLSECVDAVLAEVEADRVINEILLPAMQEVGAGFGQGGVPLPFVLASAETMRAAIDLVAPHLKGEGMQQKGTLVLATVRGDVHDIGKNLVDAILANNGFRVVNIGIRQPASNVIEAVRQEKATAIGLSGLLVSSTEAMREDLEAFRAAGLTIPVLVGGAALTPKFVEQTLAPAYGAPVYYCADAFSGLTAMEEICR